MEMEILMELGEFILFLNFLKRKKATSIII
jgi:hypothetical protein